MNIEALTHIAPRCPRQTLLRYVRPLSKMLIEYKIDTPRRQAHFLAQVAQESGEFKSTEENLKYSATRLMQVFPRYFRTVVEANVAAYNPEVIANKVYANRLGNGGQQTGDGYTFRGRGLIQLTGRSNYFSFVNHLLSLPPDRLPDDVRRILGDSTITDKVAAIAPLLSTPELAVRSACFFWKENNLNAIADQGEVDSVISAVTKRVNGSTYGLSQRKVYFYRAIVILKNQ